MHPALGNTFKLSPGSARSIEQDVGRYGILGVVAISVGAFYSTYAPIFRHENHLTHFIEPSNYIYAISKYAGQQLVIQEDVSVKPIGEVRRWMRSGGSAPRRRY